MSVLITGANGFIGLTLASSLLTHPSVTDLTLTDLTEPPAPPIPRSSPHPTNPPSTRRLALDLTNPSSISTLFPPNSTPYTAIYLLHGIMSSDSEANPSLSQAVNVRATTLLLDALVSHHHSSSPSSQNNPSTTPIPLTRVVYTSSCAVYSPLPPSPSNPSGLITEATPATASGVYGRDKLKSESHLLDLSSRGEIDAVILRLPTVIVRAGTPTGAASSFASGMFREPLQGVRSVLPVRRETKIWVTGARRLVGNLVRAGLGMAGESLLGVEKEGEKGERIVNLPGRLVSVGEMVDVLGRVGGQEALGLLEERVDEGVVRIVEGWAVRFDTAKAERLGFEVDGGLEGVVREFVEDYLGK